MNSLLYSILINSSVTTVLGTVCFFFIKAWYNKKSSKDLETHKGDIRKDIEAQLESHKGDIQKDLENLKDSYIKENLESTRFVEVICRQRIVWSDQLRDDITVIIAKTQLFVEISQKHLQSSAMDVFTKGVEMIEDEEFSTDKISSIVNNSIDNSKSSLPIKIEIIAAITRLKLKLNPTQDVSVILLLKSIRNLIENPIDSKQEIYNKLIDIQTEGQKLLKREWDRVKQEVQKGEEIEKLKSQKLPPPINLGKVNKPLISPFQKQ